ncbi:hypothetical protein GCM10009753_51810 [Streptantibioticus ferralitis]
MGKSGWDSKVYRPGFEEMMKAVRQRRVDAVVVYSLSRLTRRGALEAMKINEELAGYGVRFVSVEEPYLDTSTPMGIAIFGLIAALAQHESDLKSAYIKSAKETLRAAGGHVSGMAPYGFTSTRVAKGDLVLVQLVSDPQEVVHVRDMVSWTMEGVSARRIATWLHERNAALAEYFIHAGQAACVYSCRVPPSRTRRRMSRRAIRSGSSIGLGSGCRGRV